MVKNNSFMLNLLKNSLKIEKRKFFSIFPKQNKTLKHFPSPVREWNNSIYVFNKNSLNLIPSTTKLVNNIIKSYFNLYNKRLEYKMRAKVLHFRLRRLSSNKFYISNGGFKHTNNKIEINLYVFNRQKTNYLLKLKKLYLKTFLSVNKNSLVKQANLSKNRKNLNLRLIKRLNTINYKGIETAIKLVKNKYLLIKGLNTVSLEKKFNINNIKNFSDYTKSFYINLINKSLKKIRMYFFYKQLLYLNKSKLNYTYLQYLKKHLEKVYNKNVEFNIINLKKFYLNSDVLSELITIKISKNRRKLLKFLNKLKNKIKLEKKKSYFSTNSLVSTANKEKALLKNLALGSNLTLQKYVVNNLKYKDVTGFRLQAKGRLTKRHTASRAVSKQVHKGGIYNMDSSFRNLSSVLLKGNLRSNIQYTNLKSKTRIGSFGIKGWVSGN